MGYSYSAYAIKSGMDSDTTISIIHKIFDLKDEDFISKVLTNYNDANKILLEEMISKTKILTKITTNSPSFFEAGWKGSFWDINYADRKDDYYYPNFITKFKGQFTIIVLQSELPQDDLFSLASLLKGRTTFVSPSSEKNSAVGYGIRGLFKSNAVVISKEITEYLLRGIGDERADIGRYLISIQGKDFLFPDIEEEYRSFLYNLLPQEQKDDLNTYRIHSIDNVDILRKSFKWLLKESKICPNEAEILNQVIKDIS